MDKVARRLELLKLEGLGFSQAEVVNELSQKLSCSKRVLYKDFESREVWQPIIQSVVRSDRVLLKVLNRYEPDLPSGKPAAHYNIERVSAHGCFEHHAKS